MTMCMLSTCMGLSALAADSGEEGITLGYSDIGPDITIGESGTDIILEGNVDSSIISVTMPSYIPFTFRKEMEGQNKVLSPQIRLINNTNLPTSVYVNNNRVDLSHLSGAIWTTGANVNQNELSVGFKQSDTMPTSLTGAKWLAEGYQNTDISSLSGKGEDKLYVVGVLGSAVPENRVFTVTPTLVVRLG